MMFPLSGLRAQPHALACAAACLCAGLSSLPVQASPGSPPSSDPSLDPVVVTATRSPQPVSRVLADISVLGREALERSGATCAADLLATLPGVSFSRNGGPGGVTSVYLRGGESRHTAVYIDGLRVDSQSTGGAVWESLPVDEIERVEVLRGPAAAVYGSDAVNGVVQIFTRRGRAGWQADAALTVGSHDTRTARAGFSGGHGAWDYALSASQGRSDGYNARLTPTSNPDDDGWRRGGLQGRLGWAPAEGHRVEAALQSTRLRSQYDGSLTADDVSRHTLRSAGLGWQAHWSERLDTRVQFGESRSTYESQPSFYRTETTLRNLLLQQGLTLGGQRLDLTLERREDELLNPATAWTPTLAGERFQNAVGAGWRGEFGAHALQAHLRHDRDSEFGGHSTGSLAWGWGFAPGWRATLSAGTSLRVPTLYQRFSEYGVAALDPETGRNLEAGLRWSSQGAELGLVAWRNRVEDLIVFGAAGPCTSSFGCYENASRVRYEGLTLSGRQRLGAWSLQGSLDWHDPRNLDTDRLLPRRARKMAKLAAGYQGEGWNAGAEWQGVGARWDNAANTVRLAGYGLLNLQAGYTLLPGLTLQGRVDNVTDQDHQSANTYPQPGRTVQLALRWAMR